MPTNYISDARRLNMVCANKLYSGRDRVGTKLTVLVSVWTDPRQAGQYVYYAQTMLGTLDRPVSSSAHPVREK